MDILVNPLYDAWTHFNAKGNQEERYKALQIELQKNRFIWQSLSDMSDTSKNLSEGSCFQKRVII